MAVISHGNPAAPIWLVGAYPNFQDLKVGKALAGWPASEILQSCLKDAGINPSEVFYHSLFPSPKGEEGQQFDPMDFFYGHLRDTCKAVVCFGADALELLLRRQKINKWRGSALRIPGMDTIIIPTLSPASVCHLQKPQPLNRWLIIEDLRRAAYLVDHMNEVEPSYEIKTHPNWHEAMVWIHNAGVSSANSSYPVAIDIEIVGHSLDCFSVGYTDKGQPKSMCIPLRNGPVHYFTEREELEIIRALGHLITSPEIPKLGANIIFDLQFLLHYYGFIPRGELHCTQIAQKTLTPDYPAGLDFVTTTHTLIPYYKADGKTWMKIEGPDVSVWWHYNAMDSIVPLIAHRKQMLELSRQGNLETYNRQRSWIIPLLMCAEHGIKADTSGMALQQVKESAKLETLNAEWLELSDGINYQSPKQLVEFFYGKLGIPAYKNRKTGKPSTDTDALKRIFRRGGVGSREARLVLDQRAIRKRLSTYLDLPKVDDDGYYRSSYKPVGAETGRIASGATIFRKGGNQQNWPHDLLRFLVADEGYLLCAMDLSQIENRIVAHVGNVREQIKCFEKGIDLHALTASMIFQKPVEEISKEDGSSDLGDGKHSERDWGKRGNHALNYDVGYKTFALKYEVSEAEAKAIIARIHAGYPEIKSGYQRTIINMLIRDRTVVNLYGRRRLFLGPIIPDKFSPKSVCENTYREAFAHLPQSTCADKIVQAVQFFWNNPLFDRAIFLTQIHDSLVLEFPLAHGYEAIAQALLALKAQLELPLTWEGRSFATPADLAIGFNMCKEDMVEFKSAKIPSEPQALAELLSTTVDKIKEQKNG